jgi:SAM-dependent methyltransferase
MADYALDNAWEQARRRLALLEQQLDPLSQRRLAALGVSKGWQCLEVGGGGGSVTRWLCQQVGRSGHVMATDLDTRFLQEIDEPMLEVRRHDITADELPQAQFDLVYTRWLLHHLPQPERVIASMVAALRPGGWLLVEEVDFFPVRTSTSELYVDFMVALVETVVEESGGDVFWARSLPALVAGQGLNEIGAEGDIGVLQGGSARAEFFQLTGEQMREEVISSGALSAERFEAAMALLEDPTLWAFAGAGIAVWGRRPYNGEDQGQ